MSSVLFLAFDDSGAKEEIKTPKKEKIIPEIFIETEQYVSNEIEKEVVEEMTLDKATKHEIQRVADIYETRIVYPDYSIPLSSAQTDLLNPNQVYETPRDYSFAGLPGSILVEPVQFKFSTDEKIVAKVIVKENEGESGFMSSISSLEYKIVNEFHEFVAIMNVTNQYEEDGYMEVDISGTVGDNAPRDLMIAININLYDREVLYQTAPIQVYTSVGKVLSVKSPVYEENEVILPIVIDVNEDGFYQFSASLIDEKSGTPVTFLTHKDFVDSGKQTLNVKVHGSVLKAKNIEGPFLLKGVSLIKKAPKPGMKEKYSETTNLELKVKKIDLEKISGEKFFNENAHASLAFLRGLGS